MPTKSEKQTPREFAEKNWGPILAISGTVAAAAILLLIRYHKAEKEENGEDPDPYLEKIDTDLQGNTLDEASLILNDGLEVRGIVPRSSEILEEMESGVPTNLRELLRVLRLAK